MRITPLHLGRHKCASVRQTLGLDLLHIEDNHYLAFHFFPGPVDPEE